MAVVTSDRLKRVVSNHWTGLLDWTILDTRSYDNQNLCQASGETFILHIFYSGHPLGPSQLGGGLIMPMHRCRYRNGF